MNIGAPPGLSVQTMLQTHETTIASPGTVIRHRGNIVCTPARQRDAVLDAVIVGGGPAGLAAAAAGATSAKAAPRTAVARTARGRPPVPVLIWISVGLGESGSR